MNLVGQLTIITLAQGVLPFCSSAALSTLYIKSKFLLSSRKFVKHEWLIDKFRYRAKKRFWHNYQLNKAMTHCMETVWHLDPAHQPSIGFCIGNLQLLWSCSAQSKDMDFLCIYAMNQTHKNLAPLSSDYLSWYLISKIHFNLVSSCVLLIHINNVYPIYSQTFSKDKPLFVFLFQFSNIHNMFWLPPWSHGIWFLTDNKIASPKD